MAIGMNAHGSGTIAIVLGFAVMLGCRTSAPAWYTDPITDQDPFRLILGIPQLEFHHDETVQVTVTLQNATTRPLMGCLDYPYGFQFLGADGTNAGLITVSDGGCEAKNEFVLPPGRDLVWTRAITVPKKVTPGTAKLWYYQGIRAVTSGRHRSAGFYQKVQSSPLDVRILTADIGATAPPTSNHGSQPTVGARLLRASCPQPRLRAAYG